jgi:hypothetical protein
MEASSAHPLINPLLPEQIATSTIGWLQSYLPSQSALC